MAQYTTINRRNKISFSIRKTPGCVLSANAWIRTPKKRVSGWIQCAQCTDCEIGFGFFPPQGSSWLTRTLWELGLRESLCFTRMCEHCTVCPSSFTWIPPHRSGSSSFQMVSSSNQNKKKPDFLYSNMHTESSGINQRLSLSWTKSNKENWSCWLNRAPIFAKSFPCVQSPICVWCHLRTCSLG